MATITARTPPSRVRLGLQIRTIAEGGNCGWVRCPAVPQAMRPFTVSMAYSERSLANRPDIVGPGRRLLVEPLAIEFVQDGNLRGLLAVIEVEPLMSRVETYERLASSEVRRLARGGSPLTDRKVRFEQVPPDLLISDFDRAFEFTARVPVNILVPW